MTGAIIGDLAASTYLNDKEEFYARLVGRDATVSEYSIAALLAVRTAEAGILPTLADFRRASNLPCVEIAPEFLGEQELPHDPHSMGDWIIQRCIYANWGDAKVGLDPQPGWFDKEEGYFQMFIAKIITLLKSGWTKDEVYQQLGDVFKGCFHHWEWQTEAGGPLNYLFRAWDCFYHAFDFGSTLHNAVKCVGETRLNCALTGAIAEAMYGCRYYFVKAKYTSPQVEYPVLLQLPDALKENYSDELAVIQMQDNHNYHFWPKNNSRTNVERHIYSPVESRFEGMSVDQIQHGDILRSFEPGWENRYSFYKDNGWVYICRSFYLLGRFRFRWAGDGIYQIFDCQQTEQQPVDFDHSFQGAYEGLGYELRLDSIPFKYYQPGRLMPKIIERTVKGKFWHGEQMYSELDSTSQAKFDQAALKIYNESTDPRVKVLGKHLSAKQFGILYYINELYAKWCPYDTLEWIFDF